MVSTRPTCIHRPARTTPSSTYSLSAATSMLAHTTRYVHAPTQDGGSITRGFHTPHLSSSLAQHVSPSYLMNSLSLSLLYSGYLLAERWDYRQTERKNNSSILAPTTLSRGSIHQHVHMKPTAHVREAQRVRFNTAFSSRKLLWGRRPSSY